jgi:transposase
LESTGSWQNLSLSGILLTSPRGRSLRLFLKIFFGSIQGTDVVIYLKTLKRHLKGRKLLLVWDGLPAHRARIVRAYARTQHSWLRIERLPAYAPELNPIEYLWSAMKTKYLAGLPARGLKPLAQAVLRSKRRINGDQRLLRGFLKASTLY